MSFFYFIIGRLFKLKRFTFVQLHLDRLKCSFARRTFRHIISVFQQIFCVKSSRASYPAAVLKYPKSHGNKKNRIKIDFELRKSNRLVLYKLVETPKGVIISSNVRKIENYTCIILLNVYAAACDSKKKKVRNKIILTQLLI